MQNVPDLPHHNAWELIATLIALCVRSCFSVIVLKQTHEAKRIVQQYGRHLLLDSTHCVSDSGHQLFNIMCINQNNRGILVCSFLAEDVTADTIASGLRIFQDQCPAGYSPSVVMVDDAPTELLAIRAVFPRARPALCTWHVLRYAILSHSITLMGSLGVLLIESLGICACFAVHAPMLTRNVRSAYIKHMGDNADVTVIKKIEGAVWSMAKAKVTKRGRIEAVQRMATVYSLIGLPTPSSPDHDIRVLAKMFYNTKNQNGVFFVYHNAVVHALFYVTVINHCICIDNHFLPGLPTCRNTSCDRGSQWNSRPFSDSK
jgi:hypothetical protein